MKVAILSDIHGNLEALQAVLQDMVCQNVVEAVCLGDMVGYGADSGEVIRLLKENRIKSVMGNHEEALGLPSNQVDFNEQAMMAILKTREDLGTGKVEELKKLPLTLEFHGALCVHGCPPASIHDYIDWMDPILLKIALEQTSQRIVFVGHTHVPRCIVYYDGFLGEISLFNDGDSFNIPPGKCIINVGSVGQPRDFDERARYLIWDTRDDSVRLRFIRYNIQKAAQKIMDRGYPLGCAERLFIQTRFQPPLANSTAGKFFR